MPTATGSINLMPQLNAKNYVDTAVDNLETELNSSRVWYANCASAKNAAKEATITPATTDFELTTGTIVYVKFTTTNSLAVASLTLNVNNTGAKPIKRYGTTDLAAVGNITAGMVCQFVYDGTNWMWVGHIDTNTNTVSQTRWQNILVAADTITAGRIICGTSAGYRNIAAGVLFDLAYPLLYAGTNIAKGATSGTRDNNFLQINGINAANNVNVQSAAVGSIIYLKGTVSDNTFTIASSNFLTCVIPTTADGFCYIPIGIIYTGSSIYFNSSKDLYAYVDGAFGPVSIREASAASKTATTYITRVDDNGITIHPKTTSSNGSLSLNGNGVEVFKGTDSVAMYGSSTRIGKSNSDRVVVDPTNGITIYKGNSKRLQTTANGIDVYGSNGSTSVSSFGEEVRLGKADDRNLVIDSNGLFLNDGTETMFSIDADKDYGTNVRFQNDSDTDTTLDVFLDSSAKLSYGTLGGGDSFKTFDIQTYAEENNDEAAVHIRNSYNGSAHSNAYSYLYSSVDGTGNTPMSQMAIRTDSNFGESDAKMSQILLLNGSLSLTSSSEIRLSSESYAVGNQATFRGAIGLSSTNENLTLSDTSSGNVRVVRNEVAVTVFLNAVQLSSALANGSGVVIATMPSGYRPAVIAVTEANASTTGYPHGILFQIYANGNVELRNRTGSSLAADSHAWYAVITYVV